MTTVPIPEPFFSPGSRPTPLPDVDSDPTRRRTSRGPVVLAIAVVLAISGAIGIAVVRSQPATVTIAPDTPLVANVTDFSAYSPGGSVYDQQVPAAAGIGAVAAVSAPLAGVAAVEGGASEFAPGGSVYDQQVPAAAR